MRKRKMWKPRWLMRVGRLWPFSYPYCQRGSTYIEVLIAVVVLGFMTASVPPVLVYVSDAEFKRNEQQLGENITRNQFEYIKSADYIWGNGTELLSDPEGNETPYYARVRYEEVPVPSSYGIQVKADPIDPETGEKLLNKYHQDMGIQRITVTVFGYRYDESDNLKYIMQTQAYKVARSSLLDEYDIQ
jgi:type II secretory pathway pseudopilin PulG